MGNECAACQIAVEGYSRLKESGFCFCIRQSIELHQDQSRCMRLSHPFGNIPGQRDFAIVQLYGSGPILCLGEEWENA